MKHPRQPTNLEKSELAFWTAEEMGGFEANDHLDQAKAWVDGAAIAVFDDYISDCPGYCGKVMTVIWPAGPSLYETFIWRQEELVRLNQDLQLQKTEQPAL